MVDIGLGKWIGVLALSILASAESQAQAVPVNELQGLGELRYHRLVSSTLERDLHIYVRLPAYYGEDAPPREPMPAVYLLDGGSTLPVLSGQYHYLQLGGELPRLLLVAISYGTVLFREGNTRQTDFTAPAPDRDFWGGAGRFQRMLETELLPLIENAYPADPAQRYLFGQSLGGQFVLYNALTRPSLFAGHLASNPALHRNLPFFMTWRGATPMPRGITRLFVSSGSLEDQRFRSATLEWVRHWQDSGQTPWILEFRSLPGESHFSAVPEAFTQGMKWALDVAKGH